MYLIPKLLPIAQADFLKLLYDKMTDLHRQHAEGPESSGSSRLPSFKRGRTAPHLHITTLHPA